MEMSDTLSDGVSGSSEFANAWFGGTGACSGYLAPGAIDLDWWTLFLVFGDGVEAELEMHLNRLTNCSEGFVDNSSKSGRSYGINWLGLGISCGCTCFDLAVDMESSKGDTPRAPGKSNTVSSSGVGCISVHIF